MNEETRVTGWKEWKIDKNYLMLLFDPLHSLLETAKRQDKKRIGFCSIYSPKASPTHKLPSTAILRC